MKTACVILAAGKSKRMKSDKVKVLHKVCGVPMIRYPVQLALKRGYDPVVVVLGHQADEVKEYLTREFGDSLRFVLQQPALGTGHAVMVAKRALGKARGKLVVLYGDMPLVDTQELAALERAGRNSTLAFLTCRLSDPGKYGRVLRGPRDEVLKIVEHADATKSQRRINEINTGIYMMDAAWAYKAMKNLNRSNAQGEYYLTDLVESCAASSKTVKAMEVEANSMLGVNDRVDLAKVEKAMNLRLLHAIMASGVTVLDPGSTWIGPDVKVGRDSVILPGCHFFGKVRVGKACVIGPGAVISDSTISSGVEIKAYSVLEQSKVGRGSQIGPFARLRPGTVCGQNTKVGNFVETKKTHMGNGSKASHLTYLGDTQVGAGVNVGAGTITCNYDGVNKHPTVIGDGAFIGSDTQLVAPVKVGKGAYVGAGTTVTRDVPDHALAVSRTRQKNIEGYASGRTKAGKKE